MRRTPAQIRHQEYSWTRRSALEFAQQLRKNGHLSSNLQRQATALREAVEDFASLVYAEELSPPPDKQAPGRRA